MSRIERSYKFYKFYDFSFEFQIWTLQDLQKFAASTIFPHIVTKFTTLC